MTCESKSDHQQQGSHFQCCDFCKTVKRGRDVRKGTLVFAGIYSPTGGRQNEKFLTAALSTIMSEKKK